jgi:hypothetical protein
MLGKLDLDVAVLRADRAGVVVGRVDATHRHADIVDQGGDLLRRDDLPDRLLDVREMGGALLDARADRAAGMHQDLT